MSNEDAYNDVLDPELEDLHVIDGDEPLDDDDTVLPVAKKPLSDEDEEGFDDDTFNFPLDIDDEEGI